MTTPAELAAARFHEGYNCSQSVLLAFAERYGVPVETAARLAVPFGGGIGRQGETCGAVSGALMALGLHYGPDRPDGKRKQATYTLARTLCERFREAQGATDCRELLGVDPSTQEGYAEARERKLFEVRCPVFVAAAASIAEDLMHEEERK